MGVEGSHCSSVIGYSWLMQYELEFDTYTVTVRPVGSKWGVQIFDNETLSQVLRNEEEDPLHIEESLQAAKQWACKQLGQFAKSARDARVENPWSTSR
jgi:hypothetical protein